MKKLILLLILLSVAQMIQAQTSSTFDSTWASQFQRALDNSIVNSGVEGASAAVLVPGQGLWIGTSGNSYAAHPITADMRFGIGSNTKLFVAVLMLKLQELGVLSLDDHLGKWVSGFQNIDTSVTLRQMLSHQTGFFDPFNDSPALIDSCYSDPGKTWTPEEVLATIGAPHFTAGDAYYYSNTDYLLAGLVIEAATGKTLEQNLHQYILDPLNMDSTFLGAFETPNGPVAHEWAGNNDLGDTPNQAFYTAGWAAGYIYSTPQEMVEWYRHLFHGDIINQASLQQLLDYEPPGHYGLGILVLSWQGGGNNVFYAHVGETLGYWSLFAYDRKRESAISICFTAGTDLSVFNNMQSVLYSHFPKQANDAGITSVVSPAENSCTSTVSPIVILKNFGSSVLSSVDINYSIDGQVPAVYSWSGSLDTSGSVNVSLPDITVGDGTHSFECYTSNPNSSPEGYLFNDTTSTSFNNDIAVAEAAPFNEDFSGATFPPAGWLATSEPNLTWQKSSLVTPSKRPAVVKGNYFDQNIGSRSDLCLPMLDISGLLSPQVSFDYAYGPNFGVTDTLQILISTDCGATDQLLLNKFGSSLYTAAATFNPYCPKDPEWKHNNISLNGYSGDVLIKFRDISSGGNNLWIDNISIDESTGISNIDSKNDVTVFPNPFESNTTIRLSQNLYKATLVLFDDLGKEVKRINNIHSSSIDVERDGLPSGIYFFNLQQEGRIVARGKVVAD